MAAGAADLEQVEQMVVAPGDEVAEIKLVSVSGQAAVAGQEPTQRETPRISERGIEGNDRGGRRRRCHRCTS